MAVVVDAAAARQCRGALFGHSYGAACTMGGAALTTNVHPRALRAEPGLTYPAGSIQSIERKVASGDMEAALLEVLVEIAG